MEISEQGNTSHRRRLFDTLTLTKTFLDPKSLETLTCRVWRVQISEAFAYDSHRITVLNSARRRHVNTQGNENRYIEIEEIYLDMKIRVEIWSLIFLSSYISLF